MVRAREITHSHVAGPISGRVETEVMFDVCTFTCSKGQKKKLKWKSARKY
jgi:hypothetical protein